MIHADSNSSEGDVTVAAFAVYSQPVNCSFMSRLLTSIRRPVREYISPVHVDEFVDSFERHGRKR